LLTYPIQLSQQQDEEQALRNEWEVDQAHLQLEQAAEEEKARLERAEEDKKRAEEEREAMAKQAVKQAAVETAKCEELARMKAEIEQMAANDPGSKAPSPPLLAAAAKAAVPVPNAAPGGDASLSPRERSQSVLSAPEEDAEQEEQERQLLELLQQQAKRQQEEQQSAPARRGSLAQPASRQLAAAPIATAGMSKTGALFGSGRGGRPMVGEGEGARGDKEMEEERLRKIRIMRKEAKEKNEKDKDDEKEKAEEEKSVGGDAPPTDAAGDPK
jgi:hypothetical protein